MPYAPDRKKCLLIPSGPDLHLFVTISGRCRNNQHLLIPISTIKQGKFHDPTCIIDPGEHRFINAPSFVEYRFAMVMHFQHLITCADGMYYHPHDDVTDALLTKVEDGITASRFTKPFVIKYYNNWPAT